MRPIIGIKECKVLQKNNNIEKPLIVTSNGNYKRLQLRKLFSDELIYSDIKPNPTITDCEKAIEFILERRIDGMVAIGSGSVLDTRKIILLAYSSGITSIRKLLSMSRQEKNDIIPNIFIPTTHGSGSEVTMWATVWNKKEKKNIQFQILHCIPIMLYLMDHLLSPYHSIFLMSH